MAEFRAEDKPDGAWSLEERKKWARNKDLDWLIDSTSLEVAFEDIYKVIQKYKAERIIIFILGCTTVGILWFGLNTPVLNEISEEFFGILPPVARTILTLFVFFGGIAIIVQKAICNESMIHRKIFRKFLLISILILIVTNWIFTYVVGTADTLYSGETTNERQVTDCKGERWPNERTMKLFSDCR